MDKEVVFRLQPHCELRTSLLSLWFCTLNVEDGEDLLCKPFKQALGLRHACLVAGHGFSAKFGSPLSCLTFIEVVPMSTTGWL
jgi:hypothetical protein